MTKILSFSSRSMHRKKTSKLRKPSRLRRFLSGLFIFTLLFILVAAVAGVVFVFSYIGYINANLPDIEEFSSYKPELSTKIYDRKGRELYTVYGEENREYIKLDKVPEHVKWAVLSAEDINFYQHPGINVEAVIKAILRRVLKINTRLTGASTITQQLVRNTILNQLWGERAYERSITRKIAEMLISLQLEKKFTKDQILELYLNEIPLGGVNYGIYAAAHAYFNKTPDKLSLAEAAFLAGIIHRPSYYIYQIKSGNVEPALARRNQVLDLMLKYKDYTGVTKEQIEKAKKQPLKFVPGKINIKAPHFVFYVVGLLEDKYGADVVKTGGLRVYTTLDMDVQNIMQNEITTRMKKYCVWYGACNGAGVVINPKNGQVLAMVGSVDYNKTDDPRIDGNVNVAVSLRQMGSSVKPYTYMAAFLRGYNPGTPAPDVPMRFGAYKVVNWDERYKGPLPMSDALNASRNVPAVYTLQLVGGAPTFVNLARQLGITTLKSPDHYGLSITLGSAEMKLLEHTAAYTAFADRGVYHKPEFFLKIVDRDGKVLYKAQPKKTSRRVFSPQEVYLLNWILCMIDGTHSKFGAQYYRAGAQKLCGKTGTTDGPKDLTTILYYPRLVVGVWAGNNNGKKTFGVRGQGWSTTVALPLASAIMQKLVPKFGSEFYVQPTGITKVTVCVDTGYRAKQDTKCPKKKTVPVLSTRVPPVDNAHIKLPICKVNNKVATNAAQAKEYGLIKEKVFFKYKLANDLQTPYYLRYLKNKLGYNLYSEKPDEAECPIDAVPAITIVQPAAGATYNPGDTVQVDVTVSSSVGHNIKRIKVFFDDSLLTEIADNNTLSYTYTLPTDTEVGVHTIKVKAIDQKQIYNFASVEINVTDTTITVTPTPTPTVTPTITPSLTPTPSPTPPVTP